MNSSEIVLKKMNEMRNKIKGCLIGMLATVIVGTVLGLFAKKMLIGGLILAAAVLFYFLYVKKLTQNYDIYYAQVRAEMGICGGLENVKFTQKGGMSLEQFQKLQMFPLLKEEKALMMRNSWEGDADGAHYTGNDVTFHYEVPDAKTKDKYRFLSGTLMTMASKTAEDNGDWLLVQKELIYPQILMENVEQMGYRRAVIENEALQNDWLCFTHREENTAMPAYLANRICKLTGEYKYIGAIRLAQDVSAVYLHHRFYVGKAPTQNTPTPEQLKINPLPERDSVWSLFRFWQGMKAAD